MLGKITYLAHCHSYYVEELGNLFFQDDALSKVGGVYGEKCSVLSHE